MKLASQKEFGAALASHGILLEKADYRYGPTIPRYSRADVGERCWYPPETGEERERFFTALLEASGSWQECWCWRVERRWAFHTEREPSELDRHHFLVDRYVRSRLPRGFRGALLFPHREMELVVALASLCAAYSVLPLEDTHFIPDHAQQILYVCHDDHAHVEFETAALVRPYVEDMAAHGFPLPMYVRPERGETMPEWMMEGKA